MIWSISFLHSGLFQRWSEGETLDQRYYCLTVAWRVASFKGPHCWGMGKGSAAENLEAGGGSCLFETPLPFPGSCSPESCSFMGWSVMCRRTKAYWGHSRKQSPIMLTDLRATCLACHVGPHGEKLQVGRRQNAHRTEPLLRFLGGQCKAVQDWLLWVIWVASNWGAALSCLVPGPGNDPGRGSLPLRVGEADSGGQAQVG